MASGLLIDNDVIKKLSIYGLFSCLVEMIGAASSVGVLGAARFVLPKAIEKSKSLEDRAGALMRLADALSLCQEIEPTADQVELAAALEDGAQRLGLPLDAGESLLLAILVVDANARMLTGDKRALACAPDALGPDAAAAVAGKVGCLEQAIYSLLGAIEPDNCAQAVCSEPSTDKALSLCFGCASSFSLENAQAGLESYIEHARAAAAPLLIDGLTLEGLFQEDSEGVG